MEDINQKQRELTDFLDEASKKYYMGEDSGIDDTQFDFLLHRLQDMEKASGIVYPNSPTLRVGSDIQEGFGKVTHPSPMLTISNVYDDNGLEKWIDKVRGLYGVERFNISVKYDGISCELHYRDGVLVEASTRGDKLVGDDITENVKTIRSVPLTIPDKESDVYVRGEILFPKSMLNKINEERIINGENPFANTRNACSGSIKQLDPKVTARRGLIFRAWDLLSDEPLNMMTEKTDILISYGFHYEPDTEPFSVEGDTKTVIRAVGAFRTNLSLRSNIDFDFDGVVLKIDDLKLQEEIGTKDTRSIEWGIARKWNDEYTSVTTVEGVDFQVGRTGNITPVARLKPVKCAGVVISNATLNNEAYINTLDLHIGDEVNIIRSGGVIPLVSSNLTKLKNIPDGERGEKVVFPEVCPCCGTELEKVGEIWKCRNVSCPAKIKGQMLQWCSKDCMDIKAIGERTIEDLYNAGFRNIFELYMAMDMKPLDLEMVLGDGYGEVSVKKIQDGLRDSINRPLEKIIYGLGIDGIGKIMARSLVKHFHTFGNIFTASMESLMSIDGMGQVLASAIYDFGHRIEDLGTGDSMADIWALFLERRGFSTGEEKVPETEEKGTILPLEGLTVVFTGASKRFAGDGIEEFLEKMGAKTSHSVSKKTSFLIYGDKPGSSKMAKAESLGVRTVSEDEFFTEFGLD